MNYQISIESMDKKGLSVAIRNEDGQLVESNNARFSALKNKLKEKLNLETDHLQFDKLRKQDLIIVKEFILKANSGVIEV